MRNLTGVDWIIVTFVVVMAGFGYTQGLIVGALSLGGFAAGALLGARIAPALLAGGSESPYAPLLALMGAMTLGAVAALSVENLGIWVRRHLVRGQVTAAVDGAGGAALLAALGLGLAWITGAAALHTPGVGELRHVVQRSAILRGLNDLLPPSGSILNALNRIDPRLRVRGPAPGVPAPNAAILRDPDVDRAGNSVVHVLGTACGLGVSGSGWVAAPGLIVTNAHVVAGQEDTSIVTRDDDSLDVQAVHFDPRNDLAILRAPSLGLPPLALADPVAGAEAAVLGYPENGPYTESAARIGETATVISQDSYGRGPIQRRMTSIRGIVRDGNSGGPAVDGGGRVETTLFAGTVTGAAGGYGVPTEIVRAALSQAGGPVGTGPCVH
jgi:trypsin-like peptidase/colicin V production protein